MSSSIHPSAGATAERITTSIQLIRVDTDADAQRYGFYGLASIRVNGEDIAPLPTAESPRLACRVYRTPDWRLTPAPAYETVVAALRRTVSQQP